LLELINVTKNFGGVRAVNNFSMQVHNSEILGLIGPNGAGKTTVFNLITGIYKPDQGKILLAGVERPLNELAPHKIVACGVARTFQNIRLFNNLTVLDNVKIALHTLPQYGFLSGVLGLPLVRRENKRVEATAMEFLNLLGLAERAHMRAAGLPYGLARRLEIARALALSPRLLLLDEPAAGMNPDEIVELRELILKIQQQFRLTIVLIEHRMDLVMAICRRIVVLNFGTKLAEGSPAEIQDNAAVLSAYLGGDYGHVAG